LRRKALEVSGRLTKVVHDAVNGAGSSAGAECAVDANGADTGAVLLRPWALAEIKLTRAVEPLLLSRAAGDVADVVWSYIGTASGIWRAYPGHQVGRRAGGRAGTQAGRDGGRQVLVGREVGMFLGR
jgi:hypothetical protein